MVGGGHSEVAAQDVQAQIDPGGGAGRGEHAALVDEQHVLVDLDERVPGHECPCVVPVRRGPLAVEQARGGEREGARGDGGEPRAPGMGGDQCVDDGPRRVVAVRVPVAGDEDDVGPRERVETVLDVVREPIAAGHQTRCRPAHPHLVRHARAGREDLRGNSDIQRLRTLEDEYGDAMQTGG